MSRQAIFEINTAFGRDPVKTATGLLDYRLAEKGGDFKLNRNPHPNLQAITSDINLQRFENNSGFINEIVQIKNSLNEIAQGSKASESHLRTIKHNNQGVQTQVLNPPE